MRYSCIIYVSSHNRAPYFIMKLPSFLSQTPKAEISPVNGPHAELYEVAHTYVAPVIAGFAGHLLTIADGRKIIFAARDGLGPKQAAEVLQERFDYGQPVEPGRLVYAYLSRRSVYNSGQALVRRHLEESTLTLKTLRFWLISAFLAPLYGHYGKLCLTWSRTF